MNRLSDRYKMADDYRAEIGGGGGGEGGREGGERGRGRGKEEEKKEHFHLLQFNNDWEQNYLSTY